MSEITLYFLSCLAEGILHYVGKQYLNLFPSVSLFSCLSSGKKWCKNDVFWFSTCCNLSNLKHKIKVFEFHLKHTICYLCIKNKHFPTSIVCDMLADVYTLERARARARVCVCVCVCECVGCECGFVMTPGNNFMFLSQQHGTSKKWGRPRSEKKPMPINFACSVEVTMFDM